MSKVSGVEQKSNGDWRKLHLTHKTRISYLLDSGLYSDVIFLVGKKPVSVRAHKLILMTGSSVLHTMLINQKTSGDEGEIKIILEDIEPKIFLLFLKFLYTGDSPATPTNLIPLLEVAIRFKVEDMTRSCQVLLKAEKVAVTDDTAIRMFQRAKLFEEKELSHLTLDHICRKARTILEKNEFLTLSYNNLKEIIQKDDLVVLDEMQIFQTLLRWAKEECKRHDMEETAENQKLVLGNLTQLIRFPQMQAKEFSLKVATSGMLTTEELMSMLSYFVIPEKERATVQPPGVFNGNPRKYYEPIGKQFLVYRFAKLSSGRGKSYNGSWDRICFQVDKPIWIVSIGVSLVYQGQGIVSFKVKVQLEDEDLQNVYGSKKSILPCPNATFHVKFDKPILIAAKVWYTASTRIESSFSTYYGIGGYLERVVNCDGTSINFEFKNAKLSENGTTSSSGQIPEIVFRLD